MLNFTKSQFLISFFPIGLILYFSVCVCVCICVYVSRSVVSDSLRPHGCSPSGSSIHGILQARMLEWVANSFSIFFFPNLYCFLGSACFLFALFLKKIFICFWLCWVFVTVGFSLVVVSRGYSSRSTQASNYNGFSHCGAQALGPGASAVAAPRL